MKLSCLQENLARGLAVVGRAVASRTTLPITNNVLLATDQARLKLVATNLEIAITCWIGAKVEQDGAMTVPARLVTEFVNSLPNDRMDLQVVPPGRNVQITCARFSARIAGVDAEEFPPIPSVGEGATAQVDPQALHTAISRVVFAAATDETRPVLTGVHADFNGETLTLAAADGFRLAIQRVSLIEPAPAHTEVIIPARALSELNRLLGEQEEPVLVTVSPNRSHVQFHLKNVELVSQLIQGTFPNYSQLVPKTYASRVVLDVAEFLRATRTAAVFARDGSGIVRLQITPGEDLTPGKITIEARSEEIGDNTGEIDGVVEGEPAKIAFNGRYLQDALGALSGGKVALETTSPSSPGVLRPIGSDDYTHVVMPMFVQW
ncbi:MAG: DNA polymerase III subunit beta [Chloroflexi bacterium]|nr:DNA polymerase III subunit beta [Chloroflexota bacterium]